MQIDVKALRRAMAAKGYTVASLARAAGISHIVINKWLRRETHPRMDTLGKVAKALDVDIYDIARED